VSSISPVVVVRRCVVHSRVVEPVILCSIPTSPTCSKHDLVGIPRVSKKSQESGEDEASSVVFTKCATKSSDILHNSSLIHRNYSVEEKIFSN
jgi:hypothetical protein